MDNLHPIRDQLYRDWSKQYSLGDPRAVGWVNQEALDKRFHLTRDLLECESKSSVLDYGCGASLNLLKYIKPENYLGVDIREESLDLAIKEYGESLEVKRISVLEDINEGRHLSTVEEFYSLDYTLLKKWDRIVCQGVYQEFPSIQEIRENILSLVRQLNDNGIFVAMTPSNREVNFDAPAVMRLSVHDLVSILEETNLPYDIYSGVLGEHLVFRVHNRR